MNIYNAGINSAIRASHNPQSARVAGYARTYATPANLIGLGGGILAIFCLLVLPSSQNWNIRLPLYLVLIIWTLLRPRITLYLLPIAVPWGSLDTITLAGLNLNSADILVVLLVISWLIGFTSRLPMTRLQDGSRDRETFNAPCYLVIAMLVLLLTMLLSMTTTLSISLSLKEIAKWLEALVILLLGTQYLRTRQQIWTLVVIICLATLSQALLGYAQYAFNLGPASFIRASSLRVYGTFDQPNPYAGYINMTLTLALALLLLGRGVALRVLAGLTALLLGGAEILSQSKGGYLALAIALIFIILAALSRRRTVLIGLLIALLCIVALYLAGLLPTSVLSLILQKTGLVNLSFTDPTTANYANSERLAHWVAGLLMFRDHPLIGVGIGNYANAYPHYAQGIFVIPLGHAHNYYINIAAEAGIFGLAGLLAFLTTVFVAGGRSLRAISQKCVLAMEQRARPSKGILLIEADATFKRLRAQLNDRALAIGLLAALISVCIHNLVDNLYVHSMTSLFVLLLVMLIRLDVGASFERTNSSRV